MRKRTNWMVVAVVAALVAAGVLLVGTAVPGATGKAKADTPSPTPSPVLNVNRNGKLVKAYTLDQLEAMTPFAGFAGYMGKAAHGPDAVTGVKVSDITKDALGASLTATQSIDVVDAPVLPSGYKQTFTGAQLLDPLTGFTLFDAVTQNPITPSGALAAVLIYTDADQNVMPADTAGPLRFIVADAINENGVMTGKYSVSMVNKLNVIDNVTITLKAKPTSVEVGRAATFSGKVTNAVAKDTIVKLRQVKANRFVLLKGGYIGPKGGFRLTYKPAKAGTWTFVITYRIGKTTFMSNQVKVTVKK